MTMITDEDIKAFMMNESFVEFDDYQRKARKFAVYDTKKFKVVYPALGLSGESGEVADKIKKWLRDGVVNKEEIARELGDVLWYLAILAEDLGYDLSDIASMNLDKLEIRKKSGKIKGSGDSR